MIFLEDIKNKDDLGYPAPAISSGYIEVLNGTFVPMKKFDNAIEMQNEFIQGIPIDGTAMVDYDYSYWDIIR